MKVYKEEFVLRATHCDLTGQWKPTAILETMQEMAGTHAELLGVGRNALIEKNVVWVVTRAEVVMDRYPSMLERISIETFPMPNRRWFFPRYFVFRDDKGEKIGHAGTLWALLDLSTRKMAKPDEVSALMPDNSDLLAPFGLPATVAEVAGTVERGAYTPLYTDLDVNGHVNNTKYMDWCCNALGIDQMRENFLARFIVNYNTEIMPGQTIRTELHRLGEDFSFSGFEGDCRHFDVGGTLKPR